MTFTTSWPTFLSGSKIRDIIKLENSTPSPLLPDADISQHQFFQNSAEKSFRGFANDLHHQWMKTADDWLTTNLPSARRVRLGGISPMTTALPIPPLNEEGLCGAFRRISIGSKNFLDENLYILDDNGHGTQMAGIIGGFVGPSHSENIPERKDILQRYEVDILGLAPFAELLILKCWDLEKDDESNVGNLSAALEYAEEQEADIIYCGIGVNPYFGQLPISPSSTPSNLHFNTLRHLEDTVLKLSQKEIPLICPAGNDGGAGLAAPALFPGAIAITGCFESYTGIDRGKYSNWALPKEEVHFTAYGGSEYEGVLTTNMYFGFTCVHGTSVSAAIATGLFARHISRHKQRDRENEYQHRLLATLGPGQLPPYNMLFPKRPKITCQQLIQNAKQYAFPLSAPEFFGNGLLVHIP